MRCAASWAATPRLIWRSRRASVAAPMRPASRRCWRSRPRARDKLVRKEVRGRSIGWSNAAWRSRRRRRPTPPPRSCGAGAGRLSLRRRRSRRPARVVGQAAARVALAHLFAVHQRPGRPARSEPVRDDAQGAARVARGAAAQARAAHDRRRTGATATSSSTVPFTGRPSSGHPAAVTIPACAPS